MRRIAREPLLTGALIALLALLIRLHRIDWGFPDIYEEATSVEKAWGIWGFGGEGPDFNPHFFNYPSFHFYLQFAVQALLRAFGRVAGTMPDAPSFQAAYHLHPSLFVGAGRVLSALLASASVFLLFLTGRRFGGMRAAIPAALFLALHAVHVQKSRFVEVDIALTFFVVLSYYFLAGATTDPRLRGLFPAAAAIGLAAATKYPGALFLLNLPLAAILAGAPIAQRRVLLAPLLAAGVFFAASPYVLLDPHAFLRDFGAESVHMRGGHFGGGTSGIAGAVRFFSAGFGWPLFLVSLLGLAAAAWKPAGRERLLVPLPILFFVLLSASRTQAVHYPLPVAPPLALLAALLLARAIPDRGARSRAVHAGAVLLLLVQPCVRIGREDALLGRTDTRTEARWWIERHIPTGSLVLLEPHGPNLRPSSELKRYAESKEFEAARRILLESASSSPWFRTAVLPSFSIDVGRSARFYRIEPLRWFEYVVVTSEIRGRYEADPDRFPVQGAFYDELDRRYKRVARFPSAPTRPGPDITVFRREGALQPPSVPHLDPEGAHDAEYLSFLRSLAGLYQEAGLADGAAAVYRALLEGNPNDSETLLYFAVLRAALGDPVGGIRLLERATRIAPTNRQIRMSLGILLCQAGRTDEGTELFRRLLAEREEAELHGNLASALMQVGRVEEAAVHLRRFLELAPHHAQAGEVRALLESLAGEG